MSSVSPLAAEGIEPVGALNKRFTVRYIVFESRSGFYVSSGSRHLEVTSDQTMHVIWDHTRTHIKSLPQHAANTGHNIEVYEV